MESEFFLNAGIPPPPPLQHFEVNTSSSVSSWLPIHSSIEMQANDCFLPNWEKSTDHSLHFESALSSLVSSPAASNSNVSNESFMMRELIGKLGNIGGEISPHSQTMLTASYGTNTGNNSTNTSCYSTPLNSPPKMNLHGMDQFHKDSLNFPSLGKPPAAAGLNSTVAEFTADPGFAERAARFSCLGSRSFNGRSDRLGLNNPELPYNGGSPLTGSGKMSRVSSSPSLKEIASQKGKKNSDRSELGNSSQEESTVSEQIPNGGEAGLRASKEMNSRKRKASSKGKAKEPPANAAKDAETNNDSNTKRSKPNEGNGNENSPSPVKAEEESKASGDDEKQNKANSKPPEPPKDYIHVRARRGQATDSHSLAERVRREKISERMKLLQDLVPGCNKVTGKALMLDEIINYVQSLQRQVEFLSMKLASVNTRLDANMDTLVSKDIFQSNHQLPHPIFPLDSSASAIFGHQPLQNPALHSNISNGTVTPCSVDPLDDGLCQNPNLQLPQLDAYNPSVPQYSTFCDGDLQTIVQMGFRPFGQNLNRETPLQSHSFHGSNQVSHMKVEM